MTHEARRKHREATETEIARRSQQRLAITEELPDLVARDQMRKDAAEEATFSGELRRVIHASGETLPKICTKIGVTATVLDDFLTGERTLRSDVIDRLAAVLGCTLSQTKKLSQTK